MAILQVKFDAPDIRTQSVCGRTEQLPQGTSARGRRSARQRGLPAADADAVSPQCIWRTDRMNEVEGLKCWANPSAPVSCGAREALWPAGRNMRGRGRIRDVDVGVVERGMPQ
jgi:hypothetical protein